MGYIRGEWKLKERLNLILIIVSSRLHFLPSRLAPIIDSDENFTARVCETVGSRDWIHTNVWRYRSWQRCRSPTPLRPVAVWIITRKRRTFDWARNSCFLLSLSLCRHRWESNTFPDLRWWNCPSTTKVLSLTFRCASVGRPTSDYQMLKREKSFIWMKRAAGGMNATSTISFLPSFLILWFWLDSFLGAPHIFEWCASQTHNGRAAKALFFFPTDSQSFVDVLFLLLVLILLFRWVEGFFGRPRLFSFLPSSFFISLSWKYILSTWNNWKIIGFAPRCSQSDRMGRLLEKSFQGPKKKKKKKKEFYIKWNWNYFQGNVQCILLLLLAGRETKHTMLPDEVLHVGLLLPP